MKKTLVDQKNPCDEQIIDLFSEFQGTPFFPNKIVEYNGIKYELIPIEPDPTDGIGDCGDCCFYHGEEKDINKRFSCVDIDIDCNVENGCVILKKVE